MYRDAFERANVLKMSLVTTTAMLAICLLALVETKNKAEASSLPQNGKIAFTSSNGAIYTVEPDGSNQRQLTTGAFPKWSPDGTEIVFAEPGEGDISVMSADGSNLINLSTTGKAYGYYPTWSPDGTSVAFSKGTPPVNMNDIFMMDLDGSNQTNLTKTPKIGELYPDFSPDGSQICFFRDSGYEGKSVPGIYVMDADGSDSTLLYEYGEDAPGQCDWSPDGKKIALTAIIAVSKEVKKAVKKAIAKGTFQKAKEKAQAAADDEVYVINTDGSGRTNLTSNSAADVNPHWSPDGKKITFASDRDGDLDIYTMDADGSDVAQVTNARYDDGAPDWQPLPRTTPPKAADGSDEAQVTKKPGVEDVDRNRPERTVIVKPGDSLWSISEERLGPEASPQRIYDHTLQMYALNRKLIGSDPDLIFVGQRLSLPPLQ